MPLASWLRARFQKHQPIAPEPKPIATGELKPDELSPNTDVIDNGVRMHIAAHDPEFPAKREAAVKTILSAIDTVAQAHGFTKKAKSWAKTGELGTVSIHLQRSRYGFDCHINLGFQSTDEAALGPWAQDDFVPLSRFMTTDAAGSDDAGILTYLDVIDDQANLMKSMDALNDQALPWLTAHLTNPDAPRQPLLVGLTPVP